MIIQIWYMWKWLHSLGGESLTQGADRRQIHQWRGFIYPVSEHAEVSSPDRWSHVSFDRPSSTTLHTITCSCQPSCPVQVPMSPKQPTGWWMYSAKRTKFITPWCFLFIFLYNLNQISGIFTLTIWMTVRISFKNYKLIKEMCISNTSYTVHSKLKSNMHLFSLLTEL